MEINTTGNISSKALYFPSKPEYSSVKDFRIRKAITENKYISKLAKDEDIFVRFAQKDNDNSSHTLILDIVDFKNKSTKKALWFTSRIFASKPTREISPEEFINKIEKPIPPANTILGNLWQLVRYPNQKYFNFNEITPFTKQSNSKTLDDTLKDAELTRYIYNLEEINKIYKDANYTAKIIKMY